MIVVTRSRERVFRQPPLTSHDESNVSLQDRTSTGARGLLRKTKEARYRVPDDRGKRRDVDPDEGKRKGTLESGPLRRVRVNRSNPSNGKVSTFF